MNYVTNELALMNWSLMNWQTDTNELALFSNTFYWQPVLCGKLHVALPVIICFNRETNVNT